MLLPLIACSGNDDGTPPDGAIDESTRGGFASGGLQLSASDGCRLSAGSVVSRDGDDRTGIVIDNAFGRFNLSTLWTSWRARLPSIRARLNAEP